MWIISGRIYDLGKGRKRVQELQEKLQSEFASVVSNADILKKTKIAKEYAEALNAWKKDKDAREKASQERANHALRWLKYTGIIFTTSIIAWPLFFGGFAQIAERGEELTDILALVGFGLAFGVCTLPFVVVVCSILFLGFFISYLKSRKDSPKPGRKPKPKHDFYPKPRGFENLERIWFEEISFMSRKEKRVLSYLSIEDEEDYGVIGEDLLVDALLLSGINKFWDVEEIHPGAVYFGLRRIVVDDNLDADLVMIGLSGIWLLECKYITGQIVVDNGTWYRRKVRRDLADMEELPNPSSITRSPYIDEIIDDPVEQWLREKKALVKILENSQLDIPEDINKLVRGGVVFTHPHSTTGVDETTAIDLGHTHEWVSKIFQFEKNARTVNLSPQQIFDITDFLLTHSKSRHEGPAISAVKLAEEIYKQARTEVIMFVDQVKHDQGIKTNQELAEQAAAFHEDPGGLDFAKTIQ